MLLADRKLTTQQSKDWETINSDVMKPIKMKMKCYVSARYIPKIKTTHTFTPTLWYFCDLGVEWMHSIEDNIYHYLMM